MANDKTTKPQDNAALADDYDLEKLALAFEQITRYMDKAIASMKMLKWMAFFALAVIIFLFLYYLYSIFTILGYW